MSSVDDPESWSPDEHYQVHEIHMEHDMIYQGEEMDESAIYDNASEITHE